MTARRRDESGAVAILVSMAAVILFVLAALVVELGQARDVRTQAQNAADAAVLAAANAMYLTTLEPDGTAAVTAALKTARTNLGLTDQDWAGCVDPSMPAGYTSIGSCISMKVNRDAQNRPTTTYVRVVVPTRHVETPLASLIGVNSVAVGAEAEAMAVRYPKAKCGVCVMESNTHVLQNGNLHTTDAGVYFNGNVTLSSQGTVSAVDTDPTDLTDVKTWVEGHATGSSWSPAPITGSPRLADPLAFLKMPFDWSQLQVKDGQSPCTAGPGRYGSYSSFGASCVLSPGLYVVTGSWSLSGSDQLLSNGATLYFVCGTPAAPRACNAAGERGGSLNATGGGGVQVSAPLTGPTAGLSIVYDRTNTSDLSFKGNGSGSSGTIYSLGAKFVYAGNGGADGTSIGMDSLIVTGDLRFSGNNATLDSHYTPSLNVPLPPELNLTK